MQHPLFNIFKQKFLRYYQGCFDSFIAPPFCAYCKQFLKVRTILCIECSQMIQPIISAPIRITKHYTMHVMAIGDYQEPLKSLILAKSWGDIGSAHQLAQLIWQLSYFRFLSCDFLIPVPLHWMRLAKRGYNQAEEMAHVLAHKKEVTCAKILYRSKHTSFQSSVSFDKRLDNVKEVFALKKVNSDLYTNKHVILVDDLMTTGATLNACAKELIKLKPASINAIVAARVI